MMTYSHTTKNMMTKQMKQSKWMKYRQREVEINRITYQVKRGKLPGEKKVARSNGLPKDKTWQNNFINIKVINFNIIPHNTYDIIKRKFDLPDDTPIMFVMYPIMKMPGWSEYRVPLTVLYKGTLLGIKEWALENATNPYVRKAKGRVSKRNVPNRK